MTDKEQLHNFISKGLAIVAVHMFQTDGFPIELFEEQSERLNARQQAALIADYYDKYPHLFKDLPHYQPPVDNLAQTPTT